MGFTASAFVFQDFVNASNSEVIYSITTYCAARAAALRKVLCVLISRAASRAFLRFTPMKYVRFKINSLPPIPVKNPSK